MTPLSGRNQPPTATDFNASRSFSLLGDGLRSALDPKSQ